MLGLLIYFIIIAAMIMWMRRSQKKQKKAAEERARSLRPGVYVMLKDGLYGTIVDLDESDAVVNVSVDGADEGCIVVDRSYIYGPVEGGISDAGTGEAAGSTGAAAASNGGKLTMAEIVKRAEELNEDENESEDDEIADDPDLNGSSADESDKETDETPDNAAENDSQE